MLELEGTLHVISLNPSVTDVETESQQGEETWLQSTELGGPGVAVSQCLFHSLCLPLSVF